MECNLGGGGSTEQEPISAESAVQRWPPAPVLQLSILVVGHLKSFWVWFSSMGNTNIGDGHKENKKGRKQQEERGA